MIFVRRGIIFSLPLYYTCKVLFSCILFLLVLFFVGKTAFYVKFHHTENITGDHVLAHTVPKTNPHPSSGTPYSESNPNTTASGSWSTIGKDSSSGILSNLTVQATGVASSRPIWKIPDCNDDLEAFNYASPSSSCAARSSFASYGMNGDCTDAYGSFTATEPSTLKTLLSVTYSTLPNGVVTYANTTVTSMVPAGDEGFCCATGSYFDCVVDAQNLQLLYWPAPTPNTACLKNQSYATDFQNGQWNSETAGQQAPTSTESIYVTDTDGFV